MTKVCVRLVWLLVVIVLAIAAWRLATLSQTRSPDQQKIINRTEAK